MLREAMTMKIVIVGASIDAIAFETGNWEGEGNESPKRSDSAATRGCSPWPVLTPLGPVRTGE
jgi:hypothetical protein